MAHPCRPRHHLKPHSRPAHRSTKRPNRNSSQWQRSTRPKRERGTASRFAKPRNHHCNRNKPRQPTQACHHRPRRPRLREADHRPGPIPGHYPAFWNNLTAPIRNEPPRFRRHDATKIPDKRPKSPLDRHPRQLKPESQERAFDLRFQPRAALSRSSLSGPADAPIGVPGACKAVLNLMLTTN